MADDVHHLDKTVYSVPRSLRMPELGEASDVSRKASMLRTKVELETLSRLSVTDATVLGEIASPDHEQGRAFRCCHEMRALTNS
jgi:pyridoxal biosynthesis lyase PdxS